MIQPQENAKSAEGKSSPFFPLLGRGKFFAALGDFFRIISHPIPLLVIVAFATALFWAKARDPFRRVEFSLKTSSGMKVKGIAVIPKKAESEKRESGKQGELPIVIYLHGSGGSLMNSGKDLRLIAEQGIAAVGLEYNQTNQAAFDEEFMALHEYLAKQKLSAIRHQLSAHSICWLGFSLGAQRQLSFLQRHPEYAPQLVVRLSGGMVEEVENEKRKAESGKAETVGKAPFNARPSTLDLEEKVVPSAIHHPLVAIPNFLLVHGENDEVFLVADCRRLAELLKAEGASVDLRIFPGQSHGFGENRAAVIRGIAEYCANTFCANFVNRREFSESIPSSSSLPSSSLSPRNEAGRELEKGDADSGLMRPPSASSPRPSPPLRAAERENGGSRTEFDLPLLNPLRLNSRPLLLHYWIPLALLLGFLLTRQYLQWRRSVTDIPRGKFGTVILGLAWILGIAAFVDTAIHLGLPRLQISEARLKLARSWLIQPRLRNNFDWLILNVGQASRLPSERQSASDEADPQLPSLSLREERTGRESERGEADPSVSKLLNASSPPALLGGEGDNTARQAGETPSLLSGITLGTLLEHLELADYNRGLVNWQVDENIYRDFVLSPVIESAGSVTSPSVIRPLPSADLDWRRPLWENFYPRIRKESDPVSAAQIVVRFLRERVTVLPNEIEQQGIRTIWETELTDAAGFERIYVAALRAAGIPARLDERGMAELLSDSKWQAAPRPIFLTLLPPPGKRQ